MVFSDFSDGYTVIDLEMTGNDCWTDLIIEMAVGIALPGGDFSTDRVLVKIDRPIPPRIVNLTGITDRDLAAGGIAIDDALAWFVERTAGRPMVGHDVIRSDRAFLLEAARVHRRAVEEGQYPQRVIDEVDDLPPWRFCDTLGLYKGYKLGVYHEPGESHRDYVQRVIGLPTTGLSFGLAAACQDLGIPTGRVRRHRAGGDVIQTQKLFEKLLELNPPG